MSWVPVQPGTTYTQMLTDHTQQIGGFTTTNTDHTHSIGTHDHGQTWGHTYMPTQTSWPMPLIDWRSIGTVVPSTLGSKEPLEEERPMRGYFEVSIIDIEDDEVVVNAYRCIADNEEKARQKALIANADKFDGFDLDNLDFVVLRLGNLRRPE